MEDMILSCSECPNAANEVDMSKDTAEAVQLLEYLFKTDPEAP